MNNASGCPLGPFKEFTCTLAPCDLPGDNCTAAYPDCAGCTGLNVLCSVEINGPFCTDVGCCAASHGCPTRTLIGECAATETPTLTETMTEAPTPTCGPQRGECDSTNCACSNSSRTCGPDNRCRCACDTTQDMCIQNLVFGMKGCTNDTYCADFAPPCSTFYCDKHTECCQFLAIPSCTITPSLSHTPSKTSSMTSLPSASPSRVATTGAGTGSGSGGANIEIDISTTTQSPNTVPWWAFLIIGLFILGAIVFLLCVAFVAMRHHRPPPPHRRPPPRTAVIRHN